MLTLGTRVPGSHWIDGETWACEGHVPSARLTAAQAECWYWGCAGRRPEVPAVEVPPVVLSFTPALGTDEDARQQAKERRDLEVIARYLPGYGGSGFAQEAVGGPTALDRKRGRCHEAACSVCGVTVWRTKKELRDQKTFICPLHRGKRP